MICSRGTKDPPQALFCMGCGRLLSGSLGQEHRFLSVAFFDLKDSTRLLAQGRDQAYATFQETLQEAAKEARSRGGFVHRFLGDGLLVLFGAPKAQGEEARRALEAAWEMVRKSPFPARAGVATGEVLWTPLGSGQAGEATAVGLPVNLAERLSKLAPPGTVLLDAETLRLAGKVQAQGRAEEVPGFGVLELYQLEGVVPSPDPPKAWKPPWKPSWPFWTPLGGFCRWQALLPQGRPFFYKPFSPA